LFSNGSLNKSIIEDFEPKKDLFSANILHMFL
jgi:hypothetical protein